MLDDRKSAILRAVVECYIRTAQPVSSAYVAELGELSVSPATVRNEMGLLEQEGYLFQPHASAGRVPTDKGYRFFVDSLPGHARLARRNPNSCNCSSPVPMASSSGCSRKPAACCRSSPTTPPSWWPRPPPNRAGCGRSSSSSCHPGWCWRWRCWPTGPSRGARSSCRGRFPMLRSSRPRRPWPGSWWFHAREKRCRPRHR